MIEGSTTFILGAGASVPYGYPTGFELRNDIIENFPRRLKAYLSKKAGDPSEADDLFREATGMVARFRDSANQSIDLWLSRNPRYAELGKIAITMSLLKCEGQNKIADAVKDGSHDWFSTLFGRMTENIRLADEIASLPNHAPVFVTFNYDRLFEYMLWQALRNSFTSVPEKAIEEILGKIKIFHVYGQIGLLPWQGGQKGYGSDHTYPDVQQASRGIRIVDERTNTSLDEAKSFIHGSEKVFFLGFSYASENISVLELPVYLNGVKEVCGTGLGLLEKEMDSVRGKLHVPRGKTPTLTIESIDCKTLLRKYL